MKQGVLVADASGMIPVNAWEGYVKIMKRAQLLPEKFHKFKDIKALNTSQWAGRFRNHSHCGHRICD